MKSIKTITGVAAASLLAMTAGSALAGENSARVLAALKAGKGHVADELIVQYRSGAASFARTNALTRVGAQEDSVLRAHSQRNDNKGDLVLVRLPVGRSMANAIRDLEKDASVEFAEPNWLVQHDAVSNDTYFTNGSLWGMYGDAGSPANQYGSQAAEAWAGNHTSCSGVYIGIIDEGFMYAHEDIAGNDWNNPYDPVNGVDDDGNGYIDDVHGWDFAGGDNSTFDGTTDDHGTHVAGTIAGVGGNGKGVAGVCWSGVKLISAKFLGRSGGTTANAILAVDYFNDLKTRHGLNIVATNNSWGGGGFSQALYDAIERANAANILFVAAAGNDGVDNEGSPHYPSSYANANIISVASITSTGTLSSFSNWGVTSVDIGAPGSAIYSSLPKSSKGKVISSYGSYSGTSMATPHVSGAVALYASSHSGASAASIKSAVIAAGTATSSLSGKTTSGKRLNASGF